MSLRTFARLLRVAIYALSVAVAFTAVVEGAAFLALSIGFMTGMFVSTDIERWAEREKQTRTNVLTIWRTDHGPEPQPLLHTSPARVRAELANLDRLNPGAIFEVRPR